MNRSDSRQTDFSRRDFLKTSAAASLGVTAASLMATGNYAYAAGSDTIRVGLVGTGGRGTGAATNAVASAPGVVVVAMGDLFQDRLDSSRKELQTHIKDAYQVTDANTFVGWDAYKGVIDSDVNYIILATPPGFRPLHMRYAVEQGKHMFVEKPIAVDPVGVRSVMGTSDLAKTKNLAIGAGTQRRHDPKYRAVIQRIHDGAIGEVLAGNVYWNQGGLWMHERKPEWSDMEWQLRNWLYFTWLSGDHIVEQHVHQIDVANWVLQAHPVRAVGMGGRQVRTDPAYGHIFDHFSVELEYPNGARVQSNARQQDNTARYVGEHFVGTRGTSNAESSIRGENPFRYEGEKVNPYEQEHRNLIESIRGGTPLNEGRQVAESVLAAIMAREAAYTGQEPTWEEVLNSDQDLTPEVMDFVSMPVPPVPMPGVTKLSRNLYAHAK